FLPKAHADLIARRSGNANLGVYTQEIPLLTLSAMAPVIRAFATGEGVGYEHYPEFQAFMSQLADAKHEAVLVSKFLPSIEDGQMAAALASGIDVCDIGCGEGVATNLMAAAYPESRFVGVDISQAAIEKAARAAGNLSLKNIEFIAADAACLDHHPAFTAGLDYITAFDAVHDQPHPQAALRNVLAVLKPGGRFSMVDIDASSHLSKNAKHPMGAFLYTVSLMHCMPVGLVDGGAGLGMMWGREKAVEMLHAAGFSSVSVLEIPDDPFNLHFYCRKAA
ncbi:MAG: class I SAM-dependent methyltransferase, partial [Desulfosarcina sp.]